MHYSDEQKAVINTDTDIKINAVAGAGKTTTLLGYAKARKANVKILYIGFNRTVRVEANERFIKAGIKVDCSTAHSLAYADICRNRNFKIENDINPFFISEVLELKKQIPDIAKMMSMANHIYKFAVLYCNSACTKATEVPYIDSLLDADSIQFASKYLDKIINYTRQLLAMMNEGKCGIFHDFYLKLYQLKNPQLNYDYILFDEGQDASGAMLDVFTNQKAKKVIVGDTHQQIYGWRNAVNSLDKVDFKHFALSNSYRFNDKLAGMAMGILDLKQILNSEAETPQINGLGNSQNTDTKIVLARSNVGLLSSAIDHISKPDTFNKIYLEGGLDAYSYTSNNVHLYDIYNLYMHKTSQIRSKFIGNFKSFDELEKYVTLTGDNEIKLLCSLVKRYGGDLPSLLKKLRDHHTESKADANMLFSTVHKSKGMEYDEVFLGDDFISEEDLLKKTNTENVLTEQQIAQLNEEINILYVAATRAKYKLVLPARLMPSYMDDVKLQPTIQTVIVTKTEYEPSKSTLTAEELLAKLAETKQSLPNKSQSKPISKPIVRASKANQPWDEEEDFLLEDLFDAGKTIPEIAQQLQRSPTAIEMRMQKIGLWLD